MNIVRHLVNLSARVRDGSNTSDNNGKVLGTGPLSKRHVNGSHQGSEDLSGDR